MIGGSSIAGSSIAGDASKMQTLVIRLSPMDSDFAIPEVFAGGGAGFDLSPMDSDFEIPSIFAGGGASFLVIPMDSDFEIPDIFAGGGARFTIDPVDSDFDMPGVFAGGGASFTVTPFDSNFDMPDLEVVLVTFVQIQPIDSEMEFPTVFAGGGVRFDLSSIDSIFDMPDTDIVIIVHGVPDFLPQLVSGNGELTIKNRENKTVQIFRADDFNTEFESLDFTTNDVFTDNTITAGRYKYVLRFVGRFEGSVIAEGQNSIQKYLRKK